MDLKLITEQHLEYLLKLSDEMIVGVQDNEVTTPYTVGENGRLIHRETGVESNLIYQPLDHCPACNSKVFTVQTTQKHEGVLSRGVLNIMKREATNVADIKCSQCLTQIGFLTITNL